MDRFGPRVGRLRAWLQAALVLALAIVAGTSFGYLRGQDRGEAPWIVRSEDNVCGLTDARMLSNPAVVVYPRLLAATPEIQRMQRDGIDPASARGIYLRARAADRVRAAAELERLAGGHCSVWKAIRHRDGRAAPDITTVVLARLVQAALAEPLLGAAR